MAAETGRAAKAFTLGPNEGERLNVVGDQIRVLADSEATGGAGVILIDETPPGMGPPLHRHNRDDEYFYILEGTVKFSVAGVESVHGAGSFACIPRGTIHSFVNAGKGALKMLVVCMPGGLEKPFRETSALGAAATPEALGKIFAKIDLEFVGPPLKV